MNHNIHPVLKLCSFLPALLLMSVIFSFSAQTGEVSAGISYEISSMLVRSGERITGHTLTEEEREIMIDKIHTPVRKAAHMSEYCLLALFVSLPLTVYGVYGWKRFVLALIFCAAFAGTDEFHQSFVGGRGPSVVDVGIDSLGAAVGCTMVALFSHIRHRSHKNG